MTWAHQCDAVVNLWDVNLGLAGQTEDWMRFEFDFEIEVTGTGRIGHGSLTSLPLLACWR